MKSLKTLSAVVLVLLAANCNESSPTDPFGAPNPERSGFVTGFAHDSSGVCIGGAVIEILDGPRAGGKVTQADPCGAVWDASGGYAISGLPANATVRLRASKQGYATREATFATNATGQSNILLLRL